MDSAYIGAFSAAPERATVTDEVYAAMHRRILTLDLAPGTKVSEIEIARQMGVSRQPVRDAFYRLSQHGFLSIRPQRATLVSQISESAIRQARFLRTAVEVETVRAACQTLEEADLRALRENLDQQAAARAEGDKERFHALDDAMHRDICVRAGVGFAWDMIHAQKSHMDRARFLSLTSGLQLAFDDHVALLDALQDRDAARAEQVMRTHLGRIDGILGQIRQENAGYLSQDG